MTRSPSWCWCLWKRWYLEGLLCFTSKGCIFFTGLLSHHRALSLRYLFHVLRNTLAPSPLVRARHLDRLEPSVREEWIKEWRSFRGGGQVKRSERSASPSPSLWSFENIFPPSTNQYDLSRGEITLNALTENDHRPVNLWQSGTWFIASHMDKQIQQHYTHVIIYSEKCFERITLY